MIIKKENSIKKQNSQSCTVWTYDFLSNKIDFATAKINGRYPEKGKALNTECDMIYYVISGKGTVYNALGEFELKQGDAFFFEKNKWYWVEGQDLFIAIPSAPAWTLDQYKEID